MEDVQQDYANRTAVLEAHPSLDGGAPHVSIHPCRHAATMKRILDSIVAASEGGGGGGSGTPTAAAAAAAVPPPTVDSYLFTFLKCECSHSKEGPLAWYVEPPLPACLPQSYLRSYRPLSAISRSRWTRASAPLPRRSCWVLGTLLILTAPRRLPLLLKIVQNGILRARGSASYTLEEQASSAVPGTFTCMSQCASQCCWLMGAREGRQTTGSWF